MSEVNIRCIIGRELSKILDKFDVDVVRKSVNTELIRLEKSQMNGAISGFNVDGNGRYKLRFEYIGVIYHLVGTINGDGSINSAQVIRLGE